VFVELAMVFKGRTPPAGVAQLSFFISLNNTKKENKNK